MSYISQLPSYVNIHFLTETEAKLSIGLAKMHNSKAINYLNQIIIEPKTKYPLNFKNVKTKVKDDMELVGFYIRCIEMLNNYNNFKLKIDDSIDKRKRQVALIFQEIKDIEFIEIYYYKFQQSKDPYYRSILSRLIAPYIQFMKLTIEKSNKMFDEEDDNTGIGFDLEDDEEETQEE